MFELTAEAIILLLRLALVALLYLFLGAVALTAARELRRLARPAEAARQRPTGSADRRGSRRDQPDARRVPCRYGP